MIYFWYLTDHPKLDKFGDFSDIAKTEVNCIKSGYRWLSIIYYSAPMAKGKVNSTDSDISEWKYPPPSSVMDDVIESVCDYSE